MLEKIKSLNIDELENLQREVSKLINEKKSIGTAKVIIDVPGKSDPRWKSWCKLLTGVDTTKTNGYAFEGQFLQCGRKAEVNIGSYLLFYDEQGSAKHHKPYVNIYRIEPDGNLSNVLDTVGWSWALDIRDETAKLFV